MNPIGEGSAGVVYLAWHINLQKKVVIKKIKDHYVGHINERREADILKRLHHRYLPQVYDFLELNGEVYTVIDFIDGNTMGEYIRQGVKFDESQVVTWTRQLLDALIYLHSQNPPIIHSDIKPSNIMIGSDGNICLIDFNISFGGYDERDASGYSEGFASPEQVRRGYLYMHGGNYQSIRLDARSDVFSLGASLYALMTGRSPARRLQQNMPLWGEQEYYSELFRRVISHSIEIDPARRYQSAEAMLSDIESMKKRDREYRRLRRRQAVFTAVFTVLLAVGGVLIWTGYETRLIELFRADVEEVKEMAESADYEKIEEAAAKVLNDDRYKTAMRKDSASEGDLYYIIANTYFEREEYGKAVEEYRKATELNRENPDYFRDYAIALARDGNLDEARDIVRNSERYHLEDEDLDLVNGEIAYAQEDDETAAEKLKSVAEEASSEKVRFRAYIVGSRAMRDSGDAVGEINFLTDGASAMTGKYQRQILSELGSAYINYINLLGTDQARGYIDSAIKVFDQLLHDETKATFDDYFNKVKLLAMQESFEDAQNLLLKMQSKYSDDYRVPMELALLEIAKLQRADESVRDYTITQKYYEDAESLYASSKMNGKSDPDMANLESLIQELKSLGWMT